MVTKLTTVVKLGAEEISKIYLYVHLVPSGDF